MKSLRLQGLRLAAHSDAVIPAYLGSRRDTSQIESLPGTVNYSAAVNDCESLVDAHAANCNLQTDGNESQGVGGIMNERRRKTQQFLQTYVHDSRTASCWPNRNPPLGDLTEA